MSKMSYFWKIKIKETLGTHAQALRPHTWACVCMLGFQKLCKASFFALKMDFRMNSTSSRAVPNPYFLTI